MEPVGDYLNTNVDQPSYNYINDVAVLREDRHKYEDLRHKPRQSRKARAESNRDGRRRGTAPAPSVDTGCCTRPPWWAWAILVIGLFIAGALTGILIFFFASPTRTGPEPTSTTTSQPVGPAPTSPPGPAGPTGPPGPTGPTPATTTAHTQIPGVSTSTTTNPGRPSTTNKGGPKNCLEVYNSGMKTSGVYSIYPNHTEVRAYCEQELQGGGWTVFQRRIDGATNFYRVWDEYKRGFGDPAGEYWLGNDNIHVLTVNQDQMLKVELESEGETLYANYGVFSIESERYNYQLYAALYSEADPPGDSLVAYSNGAVFSTKDRENDSFTCAKRHSGAWWYLHFACSPSNLNGLLRTTTERGVRWDSWKRGISMSSVRMMVKTQ